MPRDVYTLTFMSYDWKEGVSSGSIVFCSLDNAYQAFAEEIHERGEQAKWDADPLDEMELYGGEFAVDTDEGAILRYEEDEGFSMAIYPARIEDLP